MQRKRAEWPSGYQAGDSFFSIIDTQLERGERDDKEPFTCGRAQGDVFDYIIEARLLKALLDSAFILYFIFKHLTCQHLFIYSASDQ